MDNANQADESAALKKINKNLTSGKIESVQFLQEFLDNCSDAVFSENCVKWLQCCCKVEGKNRNELSSSLKMFATLIKLSRKFPELGRPIANSVTSRYMEVFARNLTGLQAGWETLEVLMTSYNNSLAVNKETLGSLLNEYLESPKPILPHQSRCFALLPCLGGGGTGGANYKTNWRQQMNRLILVSHSILKVLFKDVVELQSYDTQEIVFSDASFQDLTIRLRNTNSVLQSMLLSQYPTEKCVPVQVLFNLVRRGVSVLDGKNMDLRLVLPQVHSIMLQTLTALIVSCERALLPFSTVIVKLLDQTLQFSKNFPDLRATVYSTMCNWMVVAKTGSCVDRVAKNLLPALLNDIQTRRNVVTLKGKGKKKKNDVARSQLPVPFNESLSFAALKTLDVLFNSIGFMLTPEIHKDVQLVAIEILLSVKKHRTSTPLYGESPRCRAALYQVLLQLCLEPCSRWPPPTQFALQLLRYGQDDASPQVSSICSAALTMIDRIIHPEFSVAAFPLDYQETLKEMKRLEEKKIDDIEEADVLPGSPLSVIMEDPQEEEEVTEQFSDSAPSRDLPPKLSESNGVEVIVELENPTQETPAISKNVSEEISQNPETGSSVEEIIAIENGNPLQKTAPNGLLSNEDPFANPLQTNFVDLSSSDNEKHTRKKPRNSSDSDSSGTPVKRKSTEHHYNLRKKTPKPDVDVGVQSASKVRRLDLDSASPKSSQKSTESKNSTSPKSSQSKDSDDITILFDETIIN